MNYHAMEYKKTEINTSDSVRIISLMYDGALNFIRLAKEKLAAGDLAGKGLYTGKATAVIGELSSALNMKEGGEIANNLKMLYDYILDRLVHANLHNDPQGFDEAVRLLDILRSGWKELESKRNDSAQPIASEGANTITAGLKV